MRPGDVVGGDIEILSAAATGGMGQVFRARERSTGAVVALKLASGMSESVRDRLEREADALSRLDHEGILRLRMAGKHADARFLVLQWIEGPTLEERLQRGRLTVASALGLVHALADALGHAHARGIVHRDVKPGNVILVDGDETRPVLIDFGASCRSDASTTRTGSTIGTPAYMAPEQVRGARDLGPRADVFSLGAVLFECLTGRRAFEGDNVLAVLAKVCFESAPAPSSIAMGMPESIDRLVARLLDRDPQQRPADGTAAAALLAAALADENIEATAPTQPGSVLGQGEQRFACVLAVTGRPDGTRPQPDVVARMHDTIGQHRGQSIEMADGSIVALFTPAERSVVEPAAGIVRCALDLAMAAPDRVVTVTAGRAQSDTFRFVGPAIERATMLAREARDRTGVRVDAAIAGLLDERFDVTGDEAGLVVVGLRPRQPGEERLVCGRTVPFVGRDRELRFLEELAGESMSESRAGGALVVGEPGMGKSRLLSELVRRLSPAGEQRDTTAHRVLCAQADALAHNAPFRVIGQLVAELVLAQTGDSPEIVRKKLLARIGGAEPTDARLRTAAFLAEILGVPFDDRAPEELIEARRDPTKMSDQVQRAWLDALSTVVAERPHVIAIDDVQWCDPPSLRLLDAALRVLADRPLFVLLLGRMEASGLLALVKDAQLQRVVLGPLSRDGARRLAAAVSGESARDGEMEELLAHAQGNPFFLEELLRSRGSDGPRGGGGAPSLPESVLATVALRFDRLPAAVRRVARAASVFGTRFSTEGLAVLLGEDPRNLGESLSILREQEIVSSSVPASRTEAGHWSFRHALLRDAAYSTLTEDDRRRGHRLAGAWLERSSSEAAVLAHHFEEGGPEERALHWLVLASEAALEANDFDAVLDFGERARRRGASGETLGTLLRLEAESRRFTGDLAAASAAAIAARDLLTRGSAGWVAATTIAMRTAVMLDRIDEGESLGRELLATEGDATELRASQAVVAHILLLRDRQALAGQLLARAEARGTAEPTIAAFVHRARTTLAKFGGRLGEMLANCRIAVGAFDRAGDLRMAASQRINLGDALKEIGVYEEAEQVLREALEASLHLGLRQFAACARCNLGLVLGQTDRLDDAIRQTSVGLEEYMQSGSEARGVGGSRAYLAMLFTRTGALRDARRHVDEAHRVLATVQSLQPLALAVDVRLRLAERDLTGAHAVALRLASALEGPIEEGEGLAQLAVIEALVAAGSVPEARERARRFSAILHERAATLDDPSMREAFLRRVPQHARILELADELQR